MKIRQSYLSNLFVIPLVTLTLICGFVLLISAFVIPLLSGSIGIAVKYLLSLLLKIVEVVSSWAFIYSEVPSFNIKIIFIEYGRLGM